MVYLEEGQNLTGGGGRNLFIYLFIWGGMILGSIGETRLIQPSIGVGTNPTVASVFYEQ